MRTELRLAEHSKLAGQHVIELWYDGQFIGQVTGADGPAVKVISKHPIDIHHPEFLITQVDFNLTQDLTDGLRTQPPPGRT